MIRSRAVFIAMPALVFVAGCGQRTAEGPTAPQALTSVNVTLPADDAPFPAGPRVEAMNLHCTACHSTSMILSQPPLSPDQWKAEVTKMREVYKAPVPDAAVPDILAYLTAMSERTRQATNLR